MKQRRGWAVVLGAVLGLWGTAGGAAPLAGPAFSDTSQGVAMSPAWQQQPIVYEAAPPQSDLVVTLDQHLYPALLPLIRAYAHQHQLRIAVEEGTCGISGGALADKRVDIGGFCCPAGETDRLPGLRYHTLGIAALALIVNPQNPIEDVTLAEARQLFQGEIGDWQELAGGKGQGLAAIAPVQAVARLHCKNRPGHWRLILDNEDQFSPTLLEVSTIPDMIARVARIPDAIGYETLWMTRLHRDAPVKALRIDGFSPQDERALLAGHYPFYRTYNITTWESAATRKAEAQALVAYIQQHFAEVDAQYGFIPSVRLRQAGWRFAGEELVAAPSPP